MKTKRTASNEAPGWMPEPYAIPSRIRDLPVVRQFIQDMDLSPTRRRLEQELDWIPDKAAYVEQQYKNWLYLRRKHEGEILPPSVDIDEFWHQHILDTRAYHRHTAYIFGCYLHHFPNFGNRGKSDSRELLLAFENTQRRHLQEFGSLIYDFDEEEDRNLVEDRRANGCALPELPYFLHINKCAGHTVRRILSLNYEAKEFFNTMIRGSARNPGRVVRADGADEDMAYALAELQAHQRNLSCISANIPFGFHQFMERPLAYFSFMREPVDRCLSHWSFACQVRGQHPLWQIIQRYNFDLEKILEDGIADQLSNYQLRLLTGTPRQSPGEEDFRLAKELICERYVLVGAVEKFVACIRFLARRFRWRTSSCDPQNVGNKKGLALLPARAEKLLRDANEWDIRLYRWLVMEYLPHRLNRRS